MRASRGQVRNGTSHWARFAAVAAIFGMVLFTSAHGTAWAEPSSSESKDASTSQSASTSDTHSGAAQKKDPANKTSETKASNEKASNEKDDAPTSTVGASKSETAKPETTKPEQAEPKTAKPETAEQEQAEQEQAEPEQAEPTTPAAPDEPKPAAEPSEPTEHAPSEEPTPTDEPVVSKKAAHARTATAPTPNNEADEASIDAIDTLDEATTATAHDVEGKTVPAATLSALTIAPAAVASTLETTAVTPQPVSPLAQFIALPGRIINAVLQLVGITTSATTGQSPISPAPIADLFFAVFRKMEEAFGLHAPVVQPVPPALVYEGPLDTPTPTVKQFLDAATTEYVLGGTPAGMVPFTVNGWPVKSLHLATGSDASVWVTPENQIIIAYSGTTGGTNLLVNPLIAITQIITDLEAGLGTSTPLAFDQALDFAERVKAEAIAQGYSEDDVFVTGHSLGAWQAQYVAQQIGLNGIGFEGPGLNTVVPGNGADSLFVNTATYGDMAGFLASDLPGLSPLAPPYVPGGGAKPHYGPIVLLGDPSANTPMVNAAGLFGKGVLGTLISGIDLLGNFFAKHLPGVQAYHLDVDQDPGVVPWLGINEGPVYTGFGDMTIPEFLKAASDAGILVTP